MNSAFERLQTASHKLAEVIYNQTSANTGGAPTEEQASSASASGDATSSTTSSGGGDDNVIDAEYVDVDDDKK
jgi:molecular chaperone DnaK